MKKQIKIKIMILIVSILVTCLCVSLYFLDRSLNWNFEKIISCVIISTWVFFIPPTILHYAYKMRNSNMEYSARLGLSIGTQGFLGFLIAPYIGLKTYFMDLDEIKDHRYIND